MRRNGWQLPYHPLQVVAIAVFLALGFAFYVFFAPFVGKKLYQYVVLGFYTPLVACVFCLYFWCSATDPADSGVFRSKSCLNAGSKEMPVTNLPMQGGDSGFHDISDRVDKQNSSNCAMRLLVILPGLFALSCFCKQNSHDQSSEQQVSEDGMFYCSLCKVEVSKYSKHCRVCDKCVDGFDHHCRWLNNCVGKRNYRRFFILMVTVLLLLILQWSIGILLMVMSLRERKHFTLKISSKLGNSFPLVPYVVVVATCTVLALVATIPVSQLLFFHILLIKKGISTYEYIIALREQEQQASLGQQSPQMSPSSATAVSSAGSFVIQHGAWCTPPRLFLEDQVDIVPRESAAVLKLERKMFPERSSKGRAAPVKISPWTLAGVDGKDISRVASQARKKSKTRYPLVRKKMLIKQETDNCSDCSSSSRVVLDFNNIRRFNKRGSCSKMAQDELSESKMTLEKSGPLFSSVAVVSSPDCSSDSTELRLFRVPKGAEVHQETTSTLQADTTAQRMRTPSMSESDGYDASGGEDSDRVPSKIVHRSFQWTSLLLD